MFHLVLERHANWNSHIPSGCDHQCGFIQPLPEKATDIIGDIHGEYEALMALLDTLDRLPFVLEGPLL